MGRKDDKMPKYKFRRDLYINDSDPKLKIPQEVRKTQKWAADIDGDLVTASPTEGQWMVGHFRVNKDWCEQLPGLTLLPNRKDDQNATN